MVFLEWRRKIYEFHLKTLNGFLYYKWWQISKDKINGWRGGLIQKNFGEALKIRQYISMIQHFFIFFFLKNTKEILWFFHLNEKIQKSHQNPIINPKKARKYSTTKALLKTMEMLFDLNAFNIKEMTLIKNSSAQQIKK